MKLSILYPSLVFTRADKGRLMVIMDKFDYVDKVAELSNDVSTYTVLKSDITSSIQRKLNALITELLRSKQIDDCRANSLKCYTGLTPNFYGLPKLHKPSIHLRPIIDYSNSPLSDVVRFISSLLKPLTLSSCRNSCVFSSSFQFAKYLQSFQALSNCVMISMDVVSLFTSIPIQFALDIITKIYPVNGNRFLLNVDSVIKLVSFCLYYNCFKLIDNFYKLIHGLLYALLRLK